ncbi:MAG: tryptophan synthase subunit alpha [Chromatiales bacterium]|nr:tryptophan synthase subunit alpha [Chromatiales bacterium]
MLEQYLRERREQRDVLLMTHIVIGYPDLDTSLRTVETMVENGVDLMELQVPFSEPIADGPVILHANQKSLNAGTRVEDCFEFASEVTRRFDIPFIFMTYYNILYQYGVDAFVASMRERGLRGAIVPDLPPEEASAYLDAMRKQSLDPIFIYSPSTTDERLKYLAEYASGFVYCVARKGVTGSSTKFSDELGGYLARCRAATDLPLAVGFGVQDRDDVAFLKGHADIAVVGSQSIRVLDNDGVSAVGSFVRKLV